VELRRAIATSYLVIRLGVEIFVLCRASTKSMASEC
jgi:hypothetical protein